MTPRAGRPVFVVPHTHWDREWYEPVSRFRQRLVDVVDHVLDVLEQPERRFRFFLDGQTILVEDYLAVRPDARSRIAGLVAQGKLCVGPWYVLSDELLSSDECLVRNLLVGVRDSETLGGTTPVGYSPDAFGHPAALPTILQGFGIEHAILWRGYGGEPGQEGDLFRWVGPDGSAVLTHHLPPDGYEFGANLPADPEALASRWQRIVDGLSPRAGDRPLLLLNGADHHAPQSSLEGALELVRRFDRNHDPVIARPSDYFAAVSGASNLPAVSGELRFSYRYTWTLQGVHATRVRVKAAIAEGDRLLLRWAEPQVALARAAGGTDRRPALALAWRDHLRGHFHDTLAGTTSDAVARDAVNRAAGVVVQARGAMVDALHERLGQDRAVARRAEHRWTPTLVVVNPSPFERSGVLEATITVLRKQVGVGPGAAIPAHKEDPLPAAAPGLVTGKGVPIPVQVLGQYRAYERLDSPSDYPRQDEVRAFRVALAVASAPPFGCAAYTVTTGQDLARPASRVGVSRRGVDSDWCRVEADPSGAFLLHPKHGPSRRGLFQLLSEDDEGDTYTFQPTGRAPHRARWHPAVVRWDGPLVGALSRRFTIGDRVRGTVTARLDAGSRLIRFVMEGVNRHGQHRLRALFPLPPGVVSEPHVADMQYGPVVRTHSAVDRQAYPREWPVCTAPMHRYVSVPGGITVFARDRFEYEIGERGALAVTLLRAVGELSRGDLAARPGHAAWPAATPEANERGSFRVELALALETGGPRSPPRDWTALERLAEEFHAPLAGLMLRYGIDVPGAVTGPALTGPGLAFKALKLAERGEALVLRCVNLTDTPTVGAWRFPFAIKRARRARLDERSAATLALEQDDRVVRFTAAPREVVTILSEWE